MLLRLNLNRFYALLTRSYQHRFGVSCADVEERGRDLDFARLQHINSQGFLRRERKEACAVNCRGKDSCVMAALGKLVLLALFKLSVTESVCYNIVGSLHPLAAECLPQGFWWRRMLGYVILCNSILLSFLWLYVIVSSLWYHSLFVTSWGFCCSWHMSRMLWSLAALRKRTWLLWITAAHTNHVSMTWHQWPPCLVICMKRLA